MTFTGVHTGQLAPHSSPLSVTGQLRTCDRFMFEFGNCAVNFTVALA